MVTVGIDFTASRGMVTERRFPERRFIVDVNVGRLAKWLRVMGYDAVFPPEAGDNELVRIALREGRVLVTRDAEIARRRAARMGQVTVVRIEDDYFRSQLRQLVRDLGLNLDGGFSRCMCCNELLHPIAKEDVLQQLPAYILRSQSQFMQCATCRRVYWRGTHWSNMMSELHRVYEEVP